MSNLINEVGTQRDSDHLRKQINDGLRELHNSHRALKSMIDEYSSQSSAGKDLSQIRTLKAKQEQFNSCYSQVTSKFELL